MIQSSDPCNRYGVRKSSWSSKLSQCTEIRREENQSTLYHLQNVQLHVYKIWRNFSKWFSYLIAVLWQADTNVWNVVLVHDCSGLNTLSEREQKWCWATKTLAANKFLFWAIKFHWYQGPAIYNYMMQLPTLILSPELLVPAPFSDPIFSIINY